MERTGFFNSTEKLEELIARRRKESEREGGCCIHHIATGLTENEFQDYLRIKRYLGTDTHASTLRALLVRFLEQNKEAIE